MTKKSIAKILETKSTRLELEIRRRPYWHKIGDGLSLGYRRNVGAGSWVVRVPDGKGDYWSKAVGEADDVQPANDKTVFAFFPAHDQARIIARGSNSVGVTTIADASDKPGTVFEALDAYETDLEARGADAENVRKIRRDMHPKLGNRQVSLLLRKELTDWKTKLSTRTKLRRSKDGEGQADKTGKKLTAASVNRACTALKAALNLAANNDPRITNRLEWKEGLKAIAGASRSRNVIISDPSVISAIVAECYADPLGRDLGLLSELVAETGARPCQCEKALIEDLEGGKSPLIQMPVSRKGKGEKEVTHIATPISSQLALKLKTAGKDRKKTDLLLLTWEEKGWKKSAHCRRFEEAVERAGHAGKGITLYAFRHSSIVRQLMGAPGEMPLATRIVAANHDTSVKIIEKNYSKHITSHTTEMTRKVLVDFSAAQPRKVVNIRG